MEADRHPGSSQVSWTLLARADGYLDDRHGDMTGIRANVRKGTGRCEGRRLRPAVTATMRGTVLVVAMLFALVAPARRVDAKEYAPQQQTPDRDAVERTADVRGPGVGVLIDDADGQPGARIRAVEVGSAADHAGLIPGDRIVRLDGEEVPDWRALQRALREGQTGAPRRFGVRRGEAAFDVSIVPEIVGEHSNQTHLFEPTYRIPCTDGGRSTASVKVLAVASTAIVGLLVCGRLNGAALGTILWTAGAWIIKAVVVRTESLTLCHLAGGWMLGSTLVALITGHLVVLLLVGRSALRAGETASRASAPPWHRIVRLGSIYLIAASVAAMGLAGVMGALLPPVGSPHAFAYLARMSRSTGPAAVLLLLVDLVVLGPTAEEVTFRGIVLPWLESWMPARSSLALSSVIFGAAHVGYGYAALMPAAGGWVLGWARQRTGSLKASIALHMLLNATVAAIALTEDTTRRIVVGTIMLAVLIGAGSLVDDSAYRARVEELQRTRCAPGGP
jgi:uncharacterized protein